jgi:hypothetical protein
VERELMAVEWRSIPVRRDFFTGQLTAGMVELDPDNWAHGIWRALAVTLAEPLRKAFHEHVETHGCGCLGAYPSTAHLCTDPSGHQENGGHAFPGWNHCPVAMRLDELLPDGDRIAYG